MSIVPKEVVVDAPAAWNAQADEFNQWDELGEDEKLEWTADRAAQWALEQAAEECERAPCYLGCADAIRTLMKEVRAMDKNEFAQAELVALRKGLDEASKIIEALEAENAALKASNADHEMMRQSVDAGMNDWLNHIEKYGAMPHSIQAMRNLLERAK
jgi:hypothetical protein